MIAEFIDPAYSRFYFSWSNAFCNFCRISYLIYSYIFRFCIWIFRIWKISLLFNDPPIFDGHDRTNPRRRPALCLYGYYDGAGRFDGKIILIFSNDVG